MTGSPMTGGAATLGSAPIVDFDGTMAYLPVDWAALRRQLGVESITDLWRDGDDGGWATVAAAELAATARARPIPATLDALEVTQGFVVVTDNDESVVWEFLSGYTVLESKVLTVLGRRSHRGPKRDAEVFARAFRMASQLTRRTVGANHRAVYCGDQEYELEYARALGADTVRVLLSGELEPQAALATAPEGLR